MCGKVPDIVRGMKRRRLRAAFTLVELSVSASVMVIVVTTAMTGFIYMTKGVNQSNVQNELDTDVQVAMEKVKYHLRLSSLDKMFFYPSHAAGPYEAISFPMARDDDGDSAIDTDESGHIIWDRTMVYHVWTGEPHQLRLTVFEPRDGSLTDAQRQEQLESVVENGYGGLTHNGGNAHTEVVFENLFTWRLTPRGGAFDGYAAELSRDVNVTFGSCVLAPGAHTFKFSVLGRHPSSTGYQIGVDSLIVSPSGGRREAEAQLPATLQSGALAQRQYMPAGSWDGNYQLLFPAGAEGQYFTLTLDNDRWEETNFQQTGQTRENTTVLFDETCDPYDYVVGLQGLGTNWSATAQTGDSEGASTAPALLRGTAVRVLLRGEDMADGNWLAFNGARSKVGFRADDGQAMSLVCAFIGECASAASNSMDVAAGTQRQLYFGGQEGTAVPGGGQAWSDLLDFPIDRENSYVVSYLVADVSAGGSPRSWEDTYSPHASSSFMIPGGAAPAKVDVQAAAWSSRLDVLATNCVLGVEHLFATYPAAGSYISGIFDTHGDAPDYTEIRWSADVPGGTDIRLKVRTGDERDMSDAPAWTNVAPVPALGLMDPGNGRYAQFMAELDADEAGSLSPMLKDVTIRWTGPERVVDIGGTFSKGPDYGILSVTVDDREVITGVSIELEIFREAWGYRGSRTITSQLTAEVSPRNNYL